MYHALHICITTNRYREHQLIQTISRVNRRYAGKEFGLIIDYIGIRDNMRQALKVYGGNASVAPTVDDIEQATSIFHEHLSVLRDLFKTTISLRL